MTIIVLDASSTVRSKIEALLLDMHFENIHIVLFENGRDALDFIEDNSVDLIFSALETEGLDGVTFVDLILRKDPKLVSKLFIVTSKQAAQHLEEIKYVGAKRFIQKPINEEVFKHFVTPEIDKILQHS